MRGGPSVTSAFPSKRASYAETFPCHDVIMYLPFVIFQVASAVASNAEVFVLDGTWMSTFEIRDYFEGNINSTSPLFSSTEFNIMFMFMETCNTFAIIWSISALVVLLQADFRRRAINMYLASLCMVFLLLSSTKITLYTIQYVNLSLLDGMPYLCPAIETILFAMECATGLLVTTISVERYMAIVHPFSRMADISPATVRKVGRVLWTQCMWQNRFFFRHSSATVLHVCRDEYICGRAGLIPAQFCHSIACLQGLVPSNI